MSEDRVEGWSNVYDRSRKWGIFDVASLRIGNDDSPDNCAECRRKRLKELGGVTE